jgi:hypothetical protein
MKNKYLNCRGTHAFGLCADLNGVASRFIMLAGGEKPTESIPADKIEKTKAAPAVTPKLAGDEAKENAARMVKEGQAKAERLGHQTAPEVNYEAQPFSPKELKEKVNGLREIKPAQPAELVSEMEKSFKKQNGEPMDHGDVMTAEVEDEKGKLIKYALLCDKTKKGDPFRLFSGKA